MASGVNQRCVQANQANASLCSTPQANYAYVQAPIFVLNSMLDNYQMNAIFEVGCKSLADCNSTPVGWMNQYQANFRAAITTIATFQKRGNGAPLYNCDQHCAEQESTGFNGITVPAGSASGGKLTLMQQALTAWWNVGADAPEPAEQHTYIERCTLAGPTPCNPTCLPSGYDDALLNQLLLD